MNKVRNKIETLSEDEKMIGLYDAEMIAQKVKNTQIKNAKNEGIREEKINIAKNMLKEDIDISTISKVTGLNIQEIENLN